MNKRRGRKMNAQGRNETEQYLAISYRMARSVAWRSLSGPAARVWVELRSRYNGGNNGKVSLGWDEAARLLGLGKGTVGRAFEELQVKGFIVMTKRGQWFGRMATTWRLTDVRCDGFPPTHEYFRWQPPAPPRNRIIGMLADHIAASTGQPEDRGENSWSTAAPVSSDSIALNGAETDRLYNHGLRGSEGEQEEAEEWLRKKASS